MKVSISYFRYNGDCAVFVKNEEGAVVANGTGPMREMTEQDVIARVMGWNPNFEVGSIVRYSDYNEPY